MDKEIYFTSREYQLIYTLIREYKNEVCIKVDFEELDIIQSISEDEVLLLCEKLLKLHDVIFPN